MFTTARSPQLLQCVEQTEGQNLDLENAHHRKRHAKDSEIK